MLLYELIINEMHKSRPNPIIQKWEPIVNYLINIPLSLSTLDE